MKKRLISVVLALVVISCDDESTKKEGVEGGPCYPNSTCNEGLDCVGDVCVSQSHNVNNTNNVYNSNNTSNINNTNNGNPGELGGPCLDGGTCNAQLVCHEEVCKTDADEDGYHDGMDCDDNDASIYPGYIEECQSTCNVGVRSCMSTGVWSDCTADTNCECDTPGSSRQIDCGNCGWAMQNCNADFQWELPGACQDEGECLAGMTESEACGFCGERTRLCNAQCGWEAWTECNGEGVCEAGFEGWTTGDCSPLGQIKLTACDENCQWVDSVSCTAQCPGQARTGTTDFKDEVCVPGGAFILGYDDDLFTDNEPSRTIYLTPYYIDVFEVTNDRYRECVTDGVCSLPALPDAGDDDYYNDPTKGNYPVAYVSQAQAQIFCSWDGGRVLPTEAQWEKAAKGPAPEQKLQPWGDEIEATCTHNIFNGCFPGDYPGPVDYSADGTSYYGLFAMLGNVVEWVIDYYDASYYSNAPELDPVNTSPSQYFVLRGSHFNHLNDELTNDLNYRGIATPSTQSMFAGFRCSRTGR